MYLVLGAIPHIECDRDYLPTSCPVYEKRGEYWVKYNQHCKYDGYSPVFELNGHNATRQRSSGTITYLPKDLSVVKGRKIGGDWHVPYTIVRTTV